MNTVLSISLLLICLPVILSQGDCSKCNLAPCLGGCKCNSKCECINTDVCAKCNLPQTQGGCKCDKSCNCLAGSCFAEQGDCSKCNLAPCLGGCKCNSNCQCINTDVCAKCNVPQRQGGCKCDKSCKCLAGSCFADKRCGAASLPNAPANSAWPANKCEGSLSGQTCSAKCNEGYSGSATTTCRQTGTWGPVTGSCTNDTNGSKGFVSWDASQGQFTLDGQRFVPVGFNTYWLGLMESKTYPSKSQIEEMFVIAKNMDATVIRSHTLGVNFGSPNSLRPGTGSDPNALNPNAWDAIDYAFKMARKYGIKLIVPLLDAYEYSHGGYSSFTKSRGVEKDQFFTNMVVRADFKDYISKWLTHVNPYNGLERRKDPSLFLIELGNELGNVRTANPWDQSRVPPTKEWNDDISSYIKQLAPNHFVVAGTDEALGSATSDDFNVASIDVFSAHFYGSGQADRSRMTEGARKAAAIKKPYYVGEYSWMFGQDWFNFVESTPDIKGTVFWHMYPHEFGLQGGNPVPHDDGFTLHYPESATTLNALANHFRRMRGLATKSP